MIIITTKILWAIATSFIIISSIYMSIILKFPQFKIKTMMKTLIKNNNHDELSSFNLLMMSLAGKIGVGSIAGISLSIYLGGIGSIFWIWIISILSAILTYSETILGIIFRQKDNNLYVGGPSYYIKNGLKKPKLGIIYSIMILLSYIGGFISIQTNTITKSITQYININPIIIGIIIAIMTYYAINKGVKKIANISAKMVPIMILIYILFGFYIIALNINKIPNIIMLIIKQAFNLKSFYVGFLSSFIIGMQRGIFATEAGLGTGSMASSNSKNNPVLEGYIQMLGIYITSFLICTITAFVIILSNYNHNQIIDLNGIEIIKDAFVYHLGGIGGIVVLISIILFAFSTILTGYYYGETSLKYLIKKDNNKLIFFLKIITIINLILGCILPSELIWKIVDVMVAVLSIINIYAILKLKNNIIKETIEYKKKKV